MNVLDDKALDELETLELKATPGPWNNEADWDYVFTQDEVDEPVCGNCSERNSSFIAALRNAAPALIVAAREVLERRAADVFIRELRWDFDALRAELTRLQKERDFLVNLVSNYNAKVIPSECDTTEVAVEKLKAIIEENRLFRIAADDDFEILKERDGFHAENERLRETLALMADGEGPDAEAYQQMARVALEGKNGEDK